MWIKLILSGEEALQWSEKHFQSVILLYRSPNMLLQGQAATDGFCHWPVEKGKSNFYLKGPF